MDRCTLAIGSSTDHMPKTQYHISPLKLWWVKKGGELCHSHLWLCLKPPLPLSKTPWTPAKCRAGFQAQASFLDTRDLKERRTLYVSFLTVAMTCELHRSKAIPRCEDKSDRQPNPSTQKHSIAHRILALS